MDSRKIIIFGGILLVLILLNFFLPQAANVSVSPSNINVIQGQNIDLNVLIDPNSIPIAGVQTDILYNSSLFKINTIKEGNLFTQNGAISSFNSGTVNNSIGFAMNIYSFILGQNSIATPGTFIVINMTALGKPGSSQINLSNVKISDPNGNMVQLNIHNASINIAQTRSNITFIVTDIFTGRSIQGATVTMDGIVARSNINGEAIFNSVITGSHNYNVNAKNYLISSGIITITGDQTQNIKLTPKSKGKR